ncbi:TPA: hypothetical protein P0E04_003192 [Vibrio campbellii]|nr:hypothetical protein [Vibrio campbellii]
MNSAEFWTAKWRIIKKSKTQHLIEKLRVRQIQSYRFLVGFHVEKKFTESVTMTPFLIPVCQNLAAAPGKHNIQRATTLPTCEFT